MSVSSYYIMYIDIFLLKGEEELPDVPSTDLDFGILPTEIKRLVERRREV